VASKGDEACWCFSPHPWSSVSRWGSTRTVRIKGYDARLMRAYFSSGDEKQLRDQMKPQEEGLLKRVSAAIGVVGHACSLVSAKGECTIRTSPFTRSCVGVRGVQQDHSKLHLSSRPLLSTVLPIVLAIAVFLAAPSMSHSLYCWYTGCALLTTLLCVGLISFYMMNKVVSGKSAVVFGIVSWAGFAWQVVVLELLQSWYSFGVFCVCALIGFLYAYNHPPEARTQFSLQVVLQFLSLAVIFNASPNPLCEGVSVVGLLCMSYAYNQLYAHRGTKRSVRRDSIGEGGAGMQEAKASPLRGAGSSSSSWQGGLRARSGKQGRKRLMQKQYMEENYRGPLKAEMLRNNPFHCKGAAEYLTEEEYQAQRLSYTQQQEAALLEYMQREGMAKFSHVLSPAARLSMSDRLARTYSSSDEDLDEEYT